MKKDIPGYMRRPNFFNRLKGKLLYAKINFKRRYKVSLTYRGTYLGDGSTSDDMPSLIQFEYYDNPLCLPGTKMVMVSNFPSFPLSFKIKQGDEVEVIIIKKQSNEIE